jgi:hypothetical protein
MLNKEISRVQMNLYGRSIFVDSDQVNMHTRKSAAVDLIQSLRNNPSASSKLIVTDAIKTIISLNKRIRQNVTFAS